MTQESQVGQIPGFALAGAILRREHGLAIFLQEQWTWSITGQTSIDSEIKRLCVETCGCKIFSFILSSCKGKATAVLYLIRIRTRIRVTVFSFQVFQLKSCPDNLLHVSAPLRRNKYRKASYPSIYNCLGSQRQFTPSCFQKSSRAKAWHALKKS